MHNSAQAFSYKSLVIVAISGLLIPQISFAWNDGGSFFFPTQYNSAYTQPQEQLVVYAFGPTSPSSYNTNAIGSYQPGYTHNGTSYPSQSQFAPQQPMYMNTNPYQSGSYNTMQNTNVYNYPAQFSYTSQPSYQAQYPMNNYGGYSSGGYGSGNSSYESGYGYGGGYGSHSSGGYGVPTGGTNFWGTPLCNWGYDYKGYPCDRDPHQWVFDPHTGSYY